MTIHELIVRLQQEPNQEKEIEVEEVVHAHWKDINLHKDGPIPYAFNAYQCSKCSRVEYSPCEYEDFVKQTPYCHCGAKMDEE